ncbi:MAG: phosphoribosyl-AMP cyclohydrolase [Candidatus Azotimanducaceae bacterium]|jgi:phosphoribosyl-AMP cyclohydrolase
MADWLDDIAFNAEGLVPAIALDAEQHDVLMMAWMNRDSLTETAQTGVATYWSRSRGQLWRKGESSGHTQLVQELRLDCDGDVITLLVQQTGGIACHTGRRSCFYRKLQDGVWQIVDPVIKSPEEIYSND